MTTAGTSLARRAATKPALIITRTGNRGEGSRCRFSNQRQVIRLVAGVVRVGELAYPFGRRLGMSADAPAPFQSHFNPPQS